MDKGKEKAVSASDNTEKAAPFVGIGTSGLLLLRRGALRLLLRRAAPELCETLSGCGSSDESMSNLTRFRAGGSGVAGEGIGALESSNGALMRVAMLVGLQLFRWAFRLLLRRAAPELCDTRSGRDPGDESIPNVTRFRADGSGVAGEETGALEFSNEALMRVAMLVVLQLFRWAFRLLLRRAAPELCDTRSGRDPGDESIPNVTRFRADGSGVAGEETGALEFSNGALMRVAMLVVLQLFRWAFRLLLRRAAPELCDTRSGRDPGDESIPNVTRFLS